MKTIALVSAFLAHLALVWGKFIDPLCDDVPVKLPGYYEPPQLIGTMSVLELNRTIYYDDGDDSKLYITNFVVDDEHRTSQIETRYPIDASPELDSWYNFA